MTGALPVLLLAGGYAFAAAVQPGPFLTYLIAQSLAHGWRRTLPAAFAPLLSDGPIIVVVLLILSRLPPALLLYLRLAGGGFLLWLGYRTFRTWRTLRSDAPPSVDAPAQTLLRAALVNLLNPGPWLSWSLVMGPLLLKAWNTTAAQGAAVLAGFYGVMIASLVGVIVVFDVARRLGPQVTRTLVGLSTLALFVFAFYQLWTGFSGLRAGGFSWR